MSRRSWTWWLCRAICGQLVTVFAPLSWPGPYYREKDSTWTVVSSFPERVCFCYLWPGRGKPSWRIWFYVLSAGSPVQLPACAFNRL